MKLLPLCRSSRCRQPGDLKFRWKDGKHVQLGFARVGKMAVRGNGALDQYPK
jgi:hypothetical protein